MIGAKPSTTLAKMRLYFHRPFFSVRKTASSSLQISKAVLGKHRPSFTQPHFQKIGNRVGQRIASGSGAGFTLIELLIVAAIFSLTALLSATVFSNVQSSQRTAQNQQRVTSDGRYIMEAIARSVRTGTINYSIYPKGEVPANNDYLAVTDQLGVVTCYWLDPTAKQAKIISPATINTTNSPPTCDSVSGSSWTSFTPSDLAVTGVSAFYLSPSSDPFQPLPRSAVDCKNPVQTSTTGFDATKGACVCPAAAVSDSINCFSGQSCIASTTTSYICANPNVQPQVTIFMETQSISTSTEQSDVFLQSTVVTRIYQR